MNINLDTRIDPQPALLQFLKESLQFGWVKKLQRTAGFHTVRVNIKLDTRIDPQPALLQYLIPDPLPYKYIALVTKLTDGQDLDLSFKTSTERRTDGSRSEFQDLDRPTDGQNLDFQDLDGRTHGQTRQ
jgi:hypothetical protein